MPEEGQKAGGSESAFALRIHETNRADAIEFFKALAKGGKGKIPAELLKEENGSAGLDEAESLRKAHLKSLAEMPEDDPGYDRAVARLCLAHYLIERAGKLREIILKENSVGAFSLFVSLRESILELLSEKYYGLPTDDILDEYDDLEPMLAACSEICGLKSPPLSEIMGEYQRRLADELDGS